MSMTLVGSFVRLVRELEEEEEEEKIRTADEIFDDDDNERASERAELYTDDISIE